MGTFCLLCSAIEGTGDGRGLTTQWHLRSMIQTPGDPFHYIEAEWAEGPQVKLESGQLLCMVVPKSKEVKALAIVNFQDRSRVSLLRTRSAWDASLGQVCRPFFPVLMTMRFV